MLDNQLIQLIRNTIQPQLIVAGLPASMVQAQSFQPTQQGAFIAAATYLHKLGDTRIGWPYKVNIWDVVTKQEVVTDQTVYQTMFQMSCLFTQQPGNVNQYTASDVLNLMVYCLQTDLTVQTFSANGVGILQVNKIDNPYFSDDRQRWEANPNFTFTLTHNQIINANEPFTTDIDFKILPLT